MDRRTFNALLATTAASSLAGCVAGRGVGSAGRSALYQAIGDKLTHYDVDVESATLTRRASLTLPSSVRYVWPHPSHKYIYVCTSDNQKVFRLCALRVESDGGLTFHGEPLELPESPMHNSVDATGAYVFTCYSSPSGLSVHRINSNGTLGAQITQAAQLDMGIFPHQIRSTPHNQSVVLVTRGNAATAKKPEDPGALKLYDFRGGQLSPLANIQVGGKGGIGYGPRHLDFHPSKPWAYVALERPNQLHMHQMVGNSFAAEPSYIKRTTMGDYASDIPQVAGAVHVHPQGHTVYVSNRASGTIAYNGQQVFRGGENNIAVFSINPQTGEPTLVQNIDAQGFHVRTFSIDSSGRLLVAGTTVEMLVRDGSEVRFVPAALSVFRIGADGRLAFVQKYDAQLTGESRQLWVGLIPLPA